MELKMHQKAKMAEQSKSGYFKFQRNRDKIYIYKKDIS